MSGHKKVDVLVVGSGAAGLSAAVTAALKGASVLLAEKESVIGGTSAWSGGWLWIPRNPLAREEGIQEQEDAPLTYLQHEMGGQPADARLLTFLQQGPEMIDFFCRHTAVQFLSGSKMPDFHMSPGYAQGGRSVTAQPFDGRLLGDWLHRLRPPLETISLAGMGIAGGSDMAHFFNATRSPRSALYAARRLLRHGWQRLRTGRGQYLVNGNALMGRLLRSALDAGVSIQLNAPVARLLTSSTGVSGAVLRSDDGDIEVHAGAVILACGGFPHDRQRLAQQVPHAADGYGHFSAAPPGNQGDGIRLGESVGGQFDASLKHAMAWAPVSRVTSQAACSWSSRTWLNARSRGLSPYCPMESVLLMKPTPTTTLLPRCWPQRLRESSRQRGCWPIAGRCAAMVWATPAPFHFRRQHGCARAISTRPPRWRRWRNSAPSMAGSWQRRWRVLTTTPREERTRNFSAASRPITGPRGMPGILIIQRWVRCAMRPFMRCVFYRVRWALLAG